MIDLLQNSCSMDSLTASIFVGYFSILFYVVLFCFEHSFSVNFTFTKFSFSFGFSKLRLKLHNQVCVPTYFLSVYSEGIPYYNQIMRTLKCSSHSRDIEIFDEI